MNEIKEAVLFGLDNSEMDYSSLEKPLHKQAVADFKRLIAAAESAGFQLAIASSYRDYDRQLLIWNEKVQGIRPIFDEHDQVVDVRSLSPWQLCQKILRFSALPGASRHHWGTDLDVYDRHAIDESYEVQLSTKEVMSGGVFCPFHDWLDKQITKSASFGFFRPYVNDCGGIAPERWHLSYGPLAIMFQRQLTPQSLKKQIALSEIALKETVLEHFDELYKRYVHVDESLYP